MNSLKTKHKILYGLMTLVFLSVWYCRDIFTSTYVKLQQAYYAEQNLFGGWSMIGYTAPGSGETTNFFYGEAFDHNTTTNNASGIGWAADNKVVLNECAKGTKVTSKNQSGVQGGNWQITVTANTAGSGDVTFTSAVATADCKALTPSFESIK